jgi:hypothetical protein
MSQNPNPTPVPAQDPDDLEPEYRYAFNLPAGSVRASLVILIMLPFWILLAVPQPLGPMPLYLYFLMGLVLMFFAAHGGTIKPKHVEDSASPLHLPPYFFRVLLLLVTVGLLGYRFYVDQNNLPELAQRLTPPLYQMDPTDPHKVLTDPTTGLPVLSTQWVWLLVSLLGGFTGGWVIARLLGKWKEAFWFQDLQASVSLLACAGLTVLAIIHVLINPSVSAPVDPYVFECILTGIVAWYFGVRS